MQDSYTSWYSSGQMAGLMMLELGLVLLMAPSLLNSAGIALLLLCVALLLTWIAARLLAD
jgi:TRAP-type mannitol/chloroaromatic compound transport system permease small subunit